MLLVVNSGSGTNNSVIDCMNYITIITHPQRVKTFCVHSQEYLKTFPYFAFLAAASLSPGRL